MLQDCRFAFGITLGRWNKSNWGTRLVCGGLIIAFPLNGTALAARQQDRGHSGAPAKNAAQQPPAPAPPAGAQAPEPYIYPYSCERPKSAEQDNLCTARKAADAAEKQAVWAQNTFLLGITGTFFVILTLAATTVATWASKRSADAAVRQAEVARRTLSASLRPWVKAELVLRGPIVWTNQGGSIMLVTKMINIGNVPALGVDIEIDARSPMEGDLPAEQIAFADQFRKKGNIGFTMFPNDPVTIEYTTHINQTEITRAKSYWHDKKGVDRDELFVTLFGCVTYWSAIDDTVCQTGLIFKVRRRPDANNSVAISPTRGDVPFEALYVKRWPQEGRTD